MITIREAKSKRDLRLVAAIQKVCFPDDEDFSLKGSRWWLAIESDEDSDFEEAVGFIGVRYRYRNETGHFIPRIGVLPGHRGRRLAGPLLRHVCSAYKGRLWTYVLFNNTPSLRTFLREGFLPYDPPDRTWGMVNLERRP